ncbi:P27 family phage terminase small subunit [uncultured Dysosmobacter sp.]|uniref:P27 family phage terminase small subunit n=1 Tax=uncultured Dysosmobacter sp. TaxID=2591384 RepID=UPI00260638C5|nr:P27 family phage terminase small subunit [uncultured Dysosmobacter sp.]
MPGKRQPTAVVQANGRKHLTQAETDQRLDQEVHVPPPDKAVPPQWLPKRLHQEFEEIGEILRAAGLYAELDRDVLGQYFLARERWLKADKKAAAAIRADDEKLAREWTGVQGTYFKQARQCAESMGLSVTSRCRIVVPAAVVNAAGAAPENEDDEFSLRLRARQAAALGG